MTVVISVIILLVGEGVRESFEMSEVIAKRTPHLDTALYGPFSPLPVSITMSNLSSSSTLQPTVTALPHAAEELTNGSTPGICGGNNCKHSQEHLMEAASVPVSGQSLMSPDRLGLQSLENLTQGGKKIGQQATTTASRTSLDKKNSIQPTPVIHKVQRNSKTDATETHIALPSNTGNQFMVKSLVFNADDHKREMAVLPASSLEENAVDNVTKLSLMLFKLVTTNGISSLVDMQCARTAMWMLEVISTLEKDIPGFRYYCVLQDESEKVIAQESFRDLSSVRILSNSEFWRDESLKPALAFLWRTFGYFPPIDCWLLLQSLRKRGTKYIIVPNHPELKKNYGLGNKNGHVNVRLPPYRFDPANRVVQDVAAIGQRPKQMLFYEIDRIRNS